MWENCGILSYNEYVLVRPYTVQILVGSEKKHLKLELGRLSKLLENHYSPLHPVGYNRWWCVLLFELQTELLQHQLRALQDNRSAGVISSRVLLHCFACSWPALPMFLWELVFGLNLSHPDFQPDSTFGSYHFPAWHLAVWGMGTPNIREHCDRDVYWPHSHGTNMKFISLLEKFLLAKSF